jgi:isopentenyldiphosphate isomerase
MAYIDRIRESNTGRTDGMVPFCLGTARRGWIQPEKAKRLQAASDVFVMQNGALGLVAPLLAESVDGRSERVAEVLAELRDEGFIGGWRDELFAVAASLHAPAELLIERAAVPLFGLGGYGVHLNGFVREGKTIKLWVARRSRSKPTWPGLLDQLVAGGQPAGIGIRENLVKECAEEAAIGQQLASQAHAAGAISYCMDTPEGLRPDKLFVFDLELPSAFVPRNTDGEVEAFELWSLEQAAEAVAQTQSFKPNCALVVLDFLIRHGGIGPDEPNYHELCAGLHI